MRDRHYLDMLWEEARAAVMVRWRVDTPEVRKEVRRSLNALIEAMEAEDRKPDSS